MLNAQKSISVTETVHPLTASRPRQIKEEKELRGCLGMPRQTFRWGRFASKLSEEKKKGGLVLIVLGLGFCGPVFVPWTGGLTSSDCLYYHLVGLFQPLHTQTLSLSWFSYTTHVAVFTRALASPESQCELRACLSAPERPFIFSSSKKGQAQETHRRGEREREKCGSELLHHTSKSCS